MRHLQFSPQPGWGWASSLGDVSAPKIGHASPKPVGWSKFTFSIPRWVKTVWVQGAGQRSASNQDFPTTLSRVASSAWTHKAARKETRYLLETPYFNIKGMRICHSLPQ